MLNKFFKTSFLITALFITVNSNAATFTIKPQRPLPTTITEHGVSFAYYVVTNLSSKALNNNFLKPLPATITQVSCQPQFCQENFNLGPHNSGTDSCILKLTIKAPLNSISPEICTADKSNCDLTTFPLNVTQTNSLPFIGIGSGFYLNNSSTRFPVLATSEDNGKNWNYPKDIFTNLTSSIDPNFISGSFAGDACTGENDQSVCIATGQYLNNQTTLPLIAAGFKNATSWNYPHSVFENLQSVIDPEFVSGELKGASCSGSGTNSFCISAGNYSTNTKQLPLLAESKNGAMSWTYPASIHKNLTTSIDKNFLNGTLDNASCSKSTCHTVCIATGGYCNTTNCNPLLALSIDQGATWTYPKQIFQNLNTTIDPNIKGGNFFSSSCTGSGNETICSAAGAYYTDTQLLPLVALTNDGGSSWTYPSSIYKDLPARIGHEFTGALFNNTSCTGSGRKAVCIAAGTFFRTGPNLPILAVSRDAGNTWNYPDLIYTKLKQLVDPSAVSANFYGTSCFGKGPHATCVAAGGYCLDRGCNFENPLIALSQDGGKTWSYPPSVFTDLTAKIDPQFGIGLFRSINCSGDENHNFCVATGQFSNNVTLLPLVAISSDNGLTWTYPPSIFSNLSIQIDPNFSAGVFNCSGTAGGKLRADLGFKKELESIIKQLKINTNFTKDGIGSQKSFVPISQL